MNPPYRCLFCLRTDVGFTHVEHPVPESLGNDDWVLPVGFVCDACNQYFGSKVEGRVISSPPFILERLGFVVKSKKGRVPSYEVRPGLHMVSTGLTDQIILIAEDQYIEYYHSRIGREPLVVEQPNDGASSVSRFLLKIGLEALTLSNVDPYSQAFDAARNHARRGLAGAKWQIGYAIYPDRKHLEISTRFNELGPLVTRQLYSWEMGVMQSGDICMCFIYGQHIFAFNMNHPTITEYLLGFNRNNPAVVMRYYRDPPHYPIWTPNTIEKSCRNP